MALDKLDRMARAVEGNWAAAWASLREVRMEPPTSVDDTPEVLRVYTPGIAESLLNLVMRYYTPGPVTSHDIERIIAPYRLHHLPFQWWLLRGVEPMGLREQLAHLGMQSWGGATAMALPLQGWEPRYPPAHRNAALTRVETAADAQAALDIICDVFYVPEEPMSRWTVHNPAFRLYLARWGGKPAAALALLPQSEVVGVYHVATLTGMRRRGLAGSLLIQGLMEARAAGCTLATLTATPEARHLYEQLGFRTCGLIEQWMPGRSLTASLLYGGHAARYSDELW